MAEGYHVWQFFDPSSERELRFSLWICRRCGEVWPGGTFPGHLGCVAGPYGEPNS